MADIYLSSVDGDDGDNGSTWALAKAKLAAALTAAGAGGTVWMDSAHNESGFGATLDASSTKNAPNRILSVNRSGNPEPPTELLAGGKVRTLSGNTLNIKGYAYVYGVIFESDGQVFIGSIGDHTNWTIENGVIDLTESFTKTLQIGIENTEVHLQLLNTDIGFNYVGSHFRLEYGGKLTWRGGTLNDNVTRLFTLGGRGSTVYVEDVDLSALTGDLIVSTGTNLSNEVVRLSRCKLNASVDMKSGAWVLTTPVLELYASDSDNTNYRIYRDNFYGTLQQETTLVRDGGATDGTTPISWKIVTTSGPDEGITWFESFPILLWADATGNTTYEIEILHDSVTDLQDDEIWMVLEYPASGDAQGLIVTDKSTDLLSPTNQGDSSVTWTTTGMSNPNTQKLSVTANIGKVGQVTARIYVAKPSLTVYVDPMISAGARQWMAPGAGYLNDPVQPLPILPTAVYTGILEIIDIRREVIDI